MDHRVRGEGKNGIAQTPASADGAGPGPVSFALLETEFLKLLTTDIDAAGKWLPVLRKRIRNCSAEEQGRALRLMGRYYEAKSNHRRAIRWTQRALDVFRQCNHREGIYQCLRMLFTSHLHLGIYPRAHQYAEEALANPRLEERERLKIQVNLGVLEYRRHHYVPALHAFTQALQLLKRHPHPETEAIVLYNLANLFVFMNKFVEAKRNFEKAQRLFRTQKRALYEAHVLHAIGNLNTILGQYFHADSKLKQSRKTYLKCGDSFGAALCDIEIFRMEIRLNRMERALDRIPELARTLAKMGRSLELGLVFYHGVHAAFALKEYALAEQFLKRATQLFRKEQNFLFLALCDQVGGLLRWQRRQKAQGLAKIFQARDFFVAAGHKELELECLIYADRILEGELDPGYCQRARDLLKSPLSLQTRTQALIMVSDDWHRRGQHKRSIVSLFEAVNTIEESRASIASERRRESFFADKTEIYELLIERLFAWRHPRASPLIFKVIELSRGRQMAEELSKREALPPVLNKDEPLVMERHRLELRLKQLNRKLEHLSGPAALSSRVSELEKATVLEAIRETRTSMEALKGTIGHEDRLGMFFPIDLKPENLGALLAEDQLVVLYFLGGKDLYRLELERHRLRTFRVPLYARFERDLNLMMSLLANRVPGKMEKILQFADGLSGLLMPKKRKGVGHYIFILHKTLQSFPLALLRHRGRFLIESHCISQAPNLPALYFSLRKKQPRFRHPVFFFSDHKADPKAPERELLVPAYPDANIFQSLENAGLKEAMETCDFIHFAGHCYFNKRKPEDSYLQLAGRKWLLTKYAELRFKGQPFINLAACQSGGMAVSAGNEPHGFVISSFAAGAANILASLWDLDDEATGRWMSHFYRHLDRGLPEAYRHACLAVRTIRPEPYYWAGFCLFGRP